MKKDKCPICGSSEVKVDPEHPAQVNSPENYGTYKTSEYWFVTCENPKCLMITKVGSFELRDREEGESASTSSDS